MNFKGLIDFNKYTLALAAAGFAYAVEKFSPATNNNEKWILLGLLGILLMSIITGVAIFAAATSAMNAEASGQITRVNRTKRFLSVTGTTHSILLSVGMLLMGYMLYDKITTPRMVQTDLFCCCDKSSAPNKAPKQTQ